MISDKRIWEFLRESDADLLVLPNEGIRAALAADMWPTWLHDDIASRSRDVHWAVERHYGQCVRRSYGDDILLDRYLTIAYIRVIDLVLRHGRSVMGLTRRESQFIRRFLKPPSLAGKIMDIGCGTGVLLAELASAGYTNVCGIDMSPSSVASARERLGEAVPVLVAEPQDVLQQWGLACVETVILGDVLEHIPPQRVVPFLHDVRKLLVNGGQVIVSTPHASVGPHDVTRHYMPSGSPPLGLHLKEYRTPEVWALLQVTGFSPLQPWKFVGDQLLDRLPFWWRRKVVDRLYWHGTVGMAV